MLFSSQIMTVHKYAQAFSSIPHEFVITPLVRLDGKDEHERYMNLFEKTLSPNVRFLPIYLRSPNESFRNLLNPLKLLRDFQSIFKVIQLARPDAIIGMYLLHAYPLVFLKSVLNFKLFTLAVGGDIYEKRTITYSLVRRIVCRNSERIFVVGYELRNMIKKESNCSAIVIPTGVDPTFFRALDLKPFLRSKWGIKQEEFVVLSLCLLVKRKRVEDIIKAIRILKNNQSRSIKLIIAGEGPDKPFLEELSSQLGLETNVIFLGFVSEQEKLELLNLTDVYVLASLQEGLPFSLLEAMSSECICITTPVGDIGQVIVDGRNGFIIDLTDPNGIAEKIKEIISFPAKEISLIQRQARRTIIDGYDFRVIVKRMIDIMLRNMI